MDALIAKADAIQILSNDKKRKRHASGSSHPPKYNQAKASSSKTSKSAGGQDKTLTSVAARTALPKSLRNADDDPALEGVSSHSHIKNLKLRAQLNRTAQHAARAKSMRDDAELLLTNDGGRLHVENDMERTWRVGQDEIAQGAGGEAAKGRKEWRLDGGPYRCRYTRNGRHMAIVGKSGHVATFDWQTGTMHSELQLQETCRDITFLHDHSFYAVAQKKYAFIYDRDGVEIHRLKSHIEPTRLEFLPFHWLLASVGNNSSLTYQDTSTGAIVATHRTKLGPTVSLGQNPHTGVLCLGHTNGQVTLWTPNLPHPAVQLLAHVGPVVSLSVDPGGSFAGSGSTGVGGGEGGRYLATMGQDGMVKVWDCRNWKGEVRSWRARGGPGEVEWSARGALAVATGGSVNIYTKPTLTTSNSAPPPLYLTHPVPSRPLSGLRFCPYTDVLTIGHSAGLSSILVPGAGEPNFDSSEADPFERSKARREREVRTLLEKVAPDAITLDPDTIGRMATEKKLTTAVNETHDIPFLKLPRMERLRVQGRADETDMDGMDEDGNGEENGEGGANGKKQSREEREKRKQRGKGKSLKRYLRKQRKNVVDPTAVAIRAKLDKQRAEKQLARKIEKGEIVPRKPSALDRFRK
ncbi:BING4CT-domain-containing protein [Coniophora puteana RWD-64-598 SS2]|uniref:U three protein 7 n=1 Tax=Coniophora puteana (strain RWD-64-598) TaxID=741705 RepID=A0A5M3M9T6_CONPW|nr:BING4CT-domain-containing protein [Coniophora puteana RWD-64-598 SS2]EIW75857.1 BING4CT-domain-containing protein [Coniophora puteana RWD-64-598 SS2]